MAKITSMGCSQLTSTATFSSAYLLNDGLVDPNTESVGFTFDDVLSFNPNLSELEEETYFLRLGLNAGTNIQYALAVATA